MVLKSGEQIQERRVDVGRYGYKVNENANLFLYLSTTSRKEIRKNKFNLQSFFIFLLSAVLALMKGHSVQIDWETDLTQHSLQSITSLI
jgi:hypothetical protein